VFLVSIKFILKRYFFFRVPILVPGRFLTKFYERFCDAFFCLKIVKIAKVLPSF
jgi:hypothetical protein